MDDHKKPLITGETDNNQTITEENSNNDPERESLHKGENPLAKASLFSRFLFSWSSRLISVIIRCT